MAFPLQNALEYVRKTYFAMGYKKARFEMSKCNGIVEKKPTQRVLNGPSLLPLKEAAKLASQYGLGANVFWNGDIPVVRFSGGRKIYFGIKELEAFIDRNKTILL